MTYAKLFSSILASSIWSEADATRIVWVTLLVMADRDGVVEASLPGLAHMARVSVEDCAEALRVLSSPDPHSRTEDAEGRRVEAISGGFRLINYELYRDKCSSEERSQKAADRQRRWRDRNAASRAVTHRNAALRMSRTQSQTQTQNTEAPAACVPVENLQQSQQADRPESVPAQVWADWLTARRAKRAGPVTPTALARVVREAESAGVPLADAIAEAASRGWVSFRADWVAKGKPQVAANGRPVVAASAIHIPNMPLGTASCRCEACEAFRRRKAQ